MKTCLAFMFQNEAAWLRLHLPVWAQANLPLVGLDGGSTDGSADVVRAWGGVVFDRVFDWDFATHANTLLACCQALGYEAVLRLDPDELMWPAEMREAVGKLETMGALAFPRWHFVKDRLHRHQDWYPDNQVRAFRLPARYVNRVHECIVVGAARITDWHIFHYGWIKPMRERNIRTIAYVQTGEGQMPSVMDAPDSDYPPHVPFEERQPLDPQIIGARAPLE